MTVKCATNRWAKPAGPLAGFGTRALKVQTCVHHVGRKLHRIPEKLVASGEGTRVAADSFAPHALLPV